MMQIPPNLMRPQAMMLPPSGGGITPGPSLGQQPDWLGQLAGKGGLLGNLFRRLLAGRTGGAMGMRGPDPNPFAGLARFAGPFGNGGGPIVPSFGNWMMRR